MHVTSILASIDSEISRLEKARTILSELANSDLSSKAVVKSPAPVTARKGNIAPRKLSQTARKRMAEGQKKRWAAFRAAKIKKAATAATH